MIIDETARGTNDDSNGSSGEESDALEELIMGFVPSQDSDNIADTVASLADNCLKN